jgi:aryl-alcohol dehydrogenase-like predicted oxidoreductase
MAKTSSKKSPGVIASPEHPDMIYRRLGRTGVRVSLIGLGGFHIGKVNSEAMSQRIVRAAIDGGITFMDNCWDYHDGESERRMGKALKNGYRERVFLMTKIDGRTKASAAKQINESLKRLATDHVDLLQFHEVIRMEDPDRIFEEGGALEAVLAAQKAGKTRFIGFTGHKDPLVHMRMLDVAQEHGFRFDAVQMPVNVMDASFRSFQKKVLPRLEKEKIGVLAMKPMGGGNVVEEVLESGVATAIDLLHYAMSQPVSTVITGIDSLKILKQALEAVHTFEPLSPKRTRKLQKRTRSAASEGKFERFKTSTEHDSTAENPEWLG